ncbi:DUF86 domain-containing protein [Thiothrix eikelboomii]|uniref:HepT-like ribonuclease domain-containing protein n=1 Tax=Thiothrix eikelboomii TaxID=92487 RepID=UPI003BB07FD0
MPEQSQELYLWDILESGQAIQQYVQGIDFAGFVADRMRSAATIREFEIIGEAVGKLSVETKALRPDLPWQDIKDFRNLLIHEYFGVDLQIIWGVIGEELPLLLDGVRQILQNCFSSD